jgi:hypothetical protein
MKSNKKLSLSEILVDEFVEKAREFQTNVELTRVLKARTYKIAEANVLIGASSQGNRRYFFGLNYLTVEEMANLDNLFIAFIFWRSRKNYNPSSKVAISTLIRN